MHSLNSRLKKSLDAIFVLTSQVIKILVVVLHLFLAVENMGNPRVFCATDFGRFKTSVRTFPWICIVVDWCNFLCFFDGHAAHHLGKPHPTE